MSTPTPQSIPFPGKLAMNTMAAGAVALLWPTSALLRRRGRAADGMRRCAGVNLRSEGAKFVLSSLGLRAPPDASSPAHARRQIAAEVQTFLRQEPGLRCWLRATSHAHRPRANPRADVVAARFGADGSLAAVEAMFDLGRREAAPSPRLMAGVARCVVRAYNRTRHEDDTERPVHVGQELAAELEHEPWTFDEHAVAAALAQRVLAATWVSFEDVASEDGVARFVAPDFYGRKHGGWGALNVVARPRPADGTVDLWIQAHHAAVDGAPLQEGLSRLAQSWGRGSAPIVYPTPEAFAPSSAPKRCGSAHGRALERSQDFVDFTPLLGLRKQLDARLDTAITGRVHLTALLIWCLARQPEFDGRRFALAVDLPAEGKDGRSFAFLPIRPADYLSGAAGPRLSAYVREFNRLLALTRRRASPAYKAFGQMGLLPAPLLHRCLTQDAGRGAATIGTFGVTVLRDAEVFLSPMADVGFDDGFLAVGGMTLPASDGGRVGSASFAGPRGRSGAYPAALRRAVGECASLA